MATHIQRLNISDEQKNYIQTRLNPLVTEMIAQCLKDCPQEPAAFMLNWLRMRQPEDNQSTSAMREENEGLRREVKKMAESLRDTRGLLSSITKAETEREDKSDEEEEEDDDDDDLVDEIPMHQPKNAGKPRQSVSAEAYGQWNQKKEFVPKVIVKSAAQKERLKAVLGKSFLFSAIEEKDFGVRWEMDAELVIDAMEEKIFSAGAQIIKQGDDGDYLFVIEDGKLECFKDINGVETVVKTCEAGDVFGELALLYNTTRAANVRACTECVLWQLDRETFNAIVKDAASRKRDRNESLLRQVVLLSDVSKYELSQIADALKSEVFQLGEDVVKEGEPGNKFYIVESGELYATKNGTKVMNYQPADYFGELALLTNQERQATITAASSTVKVLSLDRRSFKRLLGPLDDIMLRRQYA